MQERNPQMVKEHFYYEENNIICAVGEEWLFSGGGVRM